MNHLIQTDLKPDANKKQFMLSRIFFVVILFFCLLVACLLVFFSSGRQGSTLYSFTEKALTLSDGWTLTDSSGQSKAIQLPYTIEYGKDGKYTLSGVLPKSDALIGTPAFCFYSNYIDLQIMIGEQPVYVYPNSETASEGATGNTYHFVRLGSDYQGKTIQIELSCQLGDDITYLLKAPQIGAKATILHNSIMQSLPSILLAGCMIVLALVLAVFYMFFKHKFKTNNATVYTSLFAILFAVYIFCETNFAQFIIPNGYSLFALTLMLLALLPIPLFGLFAEDVSTNFKRVPASLMILCSVNFIGQIILNYSGVLSFRIMLPATHATIIITISVMIVCLLLSNKKEKPEARKNLLASLPMVVGGILDIILLMINKPSFNNSFWFTLGVTVFIIIQFIRFTIGFFDIYRTSHEAEVLRDMAYLDMLTGAGNRNAYEHKLNELSEQNTHDNLCCFIVDINDLKLINDRFGHATGDAAIVETSKILRECMPKHASCFRTGGDEFVALFNEADTNSISSLAQRLSDEAKIRGSKKSIPLSIAVGSGCFDTKDESILDFIRRVDEDMYNKKRIEKSSSSYHFNQKR